MSFLIFYVFDIRDAVVYADNPDGLLPIKIIPSFVFILMKALEYLQEDEYVEVTPESIRLKKILLKEHERKRARNAVKAAL